MQATHWRPLGLGETGAVGGVEAVADLARGRDGQSKGLQYDDLHADIKIQRCGVD